MALVNVKNEPLALMTVEEICEWDKMVHFGEFVYLPNEDSYEEARRIPAWQRVVSLSGTEVRKRNLHNSEKLSPWTTRPEVSEIPTRRSEGKAYAHGSLV